VSLDDVPICDAHHHLWDLGSHYYPWLSSPEPHDFFLGDYESLKRNYLPDDYRRDAAGLNVVKTVHVEAEYRRDDQVGETRWLTGIAARYGMPNAIVAHAWFHTENSAEVLIRQAEYPLVRGIRSKPVTAAAPGDSVDGVPGSMGDPKWRAGLKRLRQHDLSWDLRVPPWHLVEAAEVVAEIPDTPVVLNHTGFPWDRSEEGLAYWREGMAALAALPNVHCKLSCLCLPDGPWTYEANRPIVLETIETFGTDRCMFASNFPVDGVRIGYREMFEAFDRMVADFSADERQALFHDNATRFYRIDG
jgi:predicted TIM-barrel fold metal-dependent hydrolase